MLRCLAFLSLLGVVFLPFLATGCHKHHSRRSTTIIVEDSGISYDYVRGVSGAEICGSYWLGDARLVLPQGVLDAAPPEDEPREGLTLIVANTLPYYLMQVDAGDLCVVDRPYEYLGQVQFAEAGYLALVELSVLQALDGLENILVAGVAVEIDPVECSIMELNGASLQIGDVKVGLN